MKGRHIHRVERVVRFDPAQVEPDTDFVVEWEETDPEVEDMDARETALQAYGDHAFDD